MRQRSGWSLPFYCRHNHEFQLNFYIHLPKQPTNKLLTHFEAGTSRSNKVITLRKKTTIGIL